jgi:hypothetical protein
LSVSAAGGDDQLATGAVASRQPTYYLVPRWGDYGRMAALVGAPPVLALGGFWTCDNAGWIVSGIRAGAGAALAGLTRLIPRSSRRMKALFGAIILVSAASTLYLSLYQAPPGEGDQGG